MIIDECRGCYLLRIAVTQKDDEKKISCELQDYDCPCKTCLTKVTCDIIKNCQYCKPFLEFNAKYSSNRDYWKKLLKEKRWEK
jgi:hypothetical protein